MTQLTVENLIKIIIGVLVFVAVIYGVYHFFKGSVIDFFNNTVPDQPVKVLLGNFKMNKKGFLLAEETLKIVLAVIAIGLLAFLLFSFIITGKMQKI